MTPPFLVDNVPPSEPAPPLDTSVFLSSGVVRMTSDKSLVYLAAESSDPPDLVARFAADQGLPVIPARSVDEVRALLNRAFPSVVVLEARAADDEVLDLCRSLKEDPFTGIVPVVILARRDEGGLPAESLAAGADEVVTFDLPERETMLRLELVLRRAERDVSVHPTTRLPGTARIERDLADRLASKVPFAVCYADLDHFKEFNDRYGYAEGDRVILVVSKILRDLIRGLAPGGFVGHIGGDDFIFTVSLDVLERCCDEVIELFDELIPYQYPEDDRRAGYFLGKDRRGNVHRIPLMSLSIGVVTSETQEFVHTAQVSALAAEMKTYAKTLPGSVYVVDRRQGIIAGPPRRRREDPVDPTDGTKVIL